MEKRIARLIPQNDGSKMVRLLVWYSAKPERKQPIILPKTEKERLRRESARRDIPMGQLVKAAVAALRDHLDPVPTDELMKVTRAMDIPAAQIEQFLQDPSVRFKADLIRLKELLGVSMSRAARTALNYEYERSKR